MPSHKTLKSVVNNIVESFASCMNYPQDDYIMGHIVKAAWRTKATDLQVNLLTGQITKSRLATPPVIDSINEYVKNFPGLVTRSNSSLEFITSAEMIITVDPTKKRSSLIAIAQESPYTCTVRIVDDRGHTYFYTKSDWWFPETE